MGKALQEVLDALQAAPTHAWDMIRDPVRRTHFGVNVALVGGPAWYFADLQTAALITASYFGLYEYLAEPLGKWLVSKGFPSLAGPYWERGPQDGETFRYW